MITVYKYGLENWRKNVCRVILPFGAEILKYQYSYGAKGEELNIWAKVDTTAAEEVCYFYVVKTGENISKRLEQRDKNKNLEYVASFVDKNDTHWHIFKAATAYGSFTATPYWGGSIQPLTARTTTTPSWTTLSGNTTNSITLSSCCADVSEGSITLKDDGNALATDVNTVED